MPAASVVPIPDGASMPEAATLPMNGLTALRGLDMLGLPVRARRWPSPAAPGCSAPT